MILPLLQKHIDNGIKSSCSFCPLSLALSDVGVYYPYVGFATMVGTIDSQRVTVYTTDAMQDFIARFDEGLPVTPHNFLVPGLERLVAK